jgi:hypothetical protein
MSSSKTAPPDPTLIDAVCDLMQAYRSASADKALVSLKLCKAISDARLTPSQMATLRERAGLSAIAWRRRYLKIGDRYDVLAPLAKSLPDDLRRLYYLTRMSEADICERVEAKQLTPETSQKVMAAWVGLDKNGKPFVGKAPKPEGLTTRSPLWIAIELVDDESFNASAVETFVLRLTSFLRAEHRRWDSVDPQILTSVSLKERMRAQRVS